MIEATKGPVLPKQTLRDWVLQQRRSARSTEAVDRFSEILKALDGLTQNKPVRSVTVENPLPPTVVGGFRGTREEAATPELEVVASAEDAAGETMDQVRPRKSWTRRNVLEKLKPNVTRKASPAVKRSVTEERNQRDAEKKAAKKARKGGRPQQGPAPMTPAERVKAYRERKRAEAAKGGKARRGRPKK